jgi:hypothetical protein
MTLDPGTALYFFGIGGNLLLILACLYFGPSLRGLCRFALWVNGIVVVLGGFFLFSVLSTMRHSSEAGLALGAALLMPAPFAAEFLALVVVYRWRMGRRARRQDANDKRLNRRLRSVFPSCKEP